MQVNIEIITVSILQMVWIRYIIVSNTSSHPMRDIT